MSSNRRRRGKIKAGSPKAQGPDDAVRVGGAEGDQHKGNRGRAREKGSEKAATPDQVPKGRARFVMAGDQFEELMHDAIGLE